MAGKKPTEEKHRINFEVPTEQLDAIRAVTIAKTGRGSISKFMREAIDEKLGRGESDPEKELLLDRFDRLNKSGRKWLLESAKIAAGNDDTREITPRPRAAKQADDETDSGDVAG